MEERERERQGANGVERQQQRVLLCYLPVGNGESGRENARSGQNNVKSALPARAQFPPTRTRGRHPPRFFGSSIFVARNNLRDIIGTPWETLSPIGSVFT